MINLAAVISKPVISICSGEIFGRAQNAVFNKKFRLTHLCVLKNESQEVINLPVSKIMHAKNNAVIVKNTAASKTEAKANSPINAVIYLYDGTIYDTVKDIILDDCYCLIKIICGGGFILYPDNIISFFESAVIVCFDKEICATLKKIKPPKKTLPLEQKAQKENKDLSLYPRNIVPQFNYLIGRKITKSIYVDGKKIAVNTVITAAIIDLCRKNRKLITLAKFNKAVKRPDNIIC